MGFNSAFKGLNAELNPICHLLALLGALHILHISGIRVRVPEDPLRFFTSSHKSFLFSASGTESTSVLEIYFSHTPNQIDPEVVVFFLALKIFFYEILVSPQRAISRPFHLSLF